MTRREAIKFIVIRSLGNFLLLLSLYGVSATFGPVLAEEGQFYWRQMQGVKFVVAQDSNGTQVQKPALVHTASESSLKSLVIPTRVPEQKVEILNPIDTQFGIVIPKLGANAKIFPNVDPQNPNEFLPVLRHGIAHAKGSVFPGMQGNVYLFAHSGITWWEAGQQNAIFYLIKDLTEGDEIVIFFENKRYDYLVTQKVIADADDISFISRDHNGEERLVLQTCWPPGTSWKRLYIVAKPK